MLAGEELAGAVETARVYSEAANRARDLQETPANSMQPEDLAKRAEAIAAAQDEVTVEVLDGDAIRAKGMGGLAAVSQGGPVDPRLIVLRYQRRRRRADARLRRQGSDLRHRRHLAEARRRDERDEVRHVGAAPRCSRRRRRSPSSACRSNLIAVVPSTENMPSGTAIKPGDVITQYNGKTVEVNNTDAEGRLILADALAYAIELGAERVVDLATLTGAVLIALGSTYAAVISNDDALAAELSAAGEESGELVWRLPLHPEYKAMMKGTVADLSNLASQARGGDDHRGRLPRGIRRRHPLGAHRHRRHRLGRQPRLHRQGRQRLRRSPAVQLVRDLVRLRSARQAPKIISVEVPVASSLPLSSEVRRASAVACLRPR